MAAGYKAQGWVTGKLKTSIPLSALERLTLALRK